jgi:MFS family permease
MNNNRQLFLASFFTLIAAGVLFGLRNTILSVWETQFHFTKGDLGVITGFGLTGFGFTIISCSLIADKVGYKALMVLAFLLHTSSAIVIMLAAPANGAIKDGAFWCLCIGNFMFSLANGVCESVINPLVATLYPNQKTHYLNILHAGWPGGLVLGTILAFCFCSRDATLVELPWELTVAFFLPPVLYYGYVIITHKFPISEARAAGVSFGTMLGEFASPILIMLLLLHAMVGYVELGTDSWITNIQQAVIHEKAMLVFIWTSSIMFVLRFFAGPIVERINPLGLLFVSGLLGATGLFWLGSTTEGLLVIFAASTVYGLGKTFLWPTMLGVVGERFPKGGALTMGAMGGIGMLSAGLLGGPGIGYKQDYYASQKLSQESPEVFERYVYKEPYSTALKKYVDKKDQVNGNWPERFGEVVEKERPKGFLIFPEVDGLDGGKVGGLKDKIANLDKKEKHHEEISEKERLTKLEEADRGPVLGAEIYGGRMALKLTAIVPAMMAVGYLLLVLYFRAKGGYQAEVLHGAKPVGEHYTGGVEGPVEA